MPSHPLNSSPAASSEALAAETCSDYVAMIAKDLKHPLHAAARALAFEQASEFALFAMDMADLVGLAMAIPSVDCRSHVAAQSARRMLGRHPEWIHAASDWAASAKLPNAALEAINRWLV